MSNAIVSAAGQPISIEIEGIKQVQADLDSLASDLKDEAALEMVTNVGIAVRDWMKENVRLLLNRNSTGALAESIFATPLTNDQGATVYVGPNSSALPYTMIHEYGGDIYPKNRRSLHFWYNGQEVFSKHVHIPARPYIAPAFTDHQDEILEIMQEVLDAAIASGCASL